MLPHLPFSIHWKRTAGPCDVSERGQYSEKVEQQESDAPPGPPTVLVHNTPQDLWTGQNHSARHEDAVFEDSPDGRTRGRGRDNSY